MFTGIITHTGKLEKRSGQAFSFSCPPPLLKKLHSGDSIAVSGACLTVEKVKNGTFQVSLMPETMQRTVFGGLKKGSLANLELPATLQSFLSGHIVEGHVDGMGTVCSLEKRGESRILAISADPKLMRYVVEKGSIAVNGISLTVIEAGNAGFTVGIIPYTWDHTMMCELTAGDFVNIETDIIAKHIEKLAAFSQRKKK